MKETIIDPKNGIYSTTHDYVHALEVQGASRQVYLSGTMGLDSFGVAPDTVDEQLELIWKNIEHILASAHMTARNIIRVTSYLTKAEFAAKNQEARLRALGDRRVPTTAIVVSTLDPNWLVEIEIIAAA